ncbi:MAG: hypothetical protein HYW49_08060 [Deltaproteobacteria bacterium]|nr:hypothetical protein [Deltaproteobacteria bacterium]
MRACERFARARCFIPAYIIFWFAWFTWVQTIGRIHGGLSLTSVLAFDAVFAFFAWKLLRNGVNNSSGTNITPSLRSLFSELPAWLRALLVAAGATLLFTAVFQVPLDWDGMDYHLPPIVESWQDGFWHRSAQPYFAARSYPKTASALALWWLAHFGSVLGLRLLLVPPLLHWCAGLAASLELVGGNKWVLLLWAAYPLAARESAAWYADLAGLSALLCFLALLKRERYVLAALALALHGSTKFSNLATAGGALIALNLYWAVSERKIMTARRAALNALLAVPLLLVAAVQPLQNLRAGDGPFGPLKCAVLGRDPCGGTLDPDDLVVAPIVSDYERSDSWVKKIARGWTPSQLVPGSDVSTGGFGWAWLPACAFGLAALARRRMRDAAPWALLSIAVVFAADLAMRAHWYARFHMPLGWALGMFAAVTLQGLEAEHRARAARVLIPLTLALAGFQIAWLVPHRTWFLGAGQGPPLANVVDNIGSIVARGYPAHATNPADVRSLKLFPLEKKRIVVCGEHLRPILPAYGARLTNRVEWHDAEEEGARSRDWGLTPCPRPEAPPEEKFEETSYRVLATGDGLYKF